MEKRTVKLTKISKIQEELDNLAKEYEVAKRDNNQEAKESIKERYEELKVLLRSNAVYFKNLNSENTSEAKEIEKQNYQNNRRYISMVEKSNTLDDYVKKNEKRTIVKKHWKKVALGATIVALIGSISACSLNKKGNINKNEVVYTSNEEIKEPTTEDVKLNDISETKEDTNIQLNALPEENNKDNIKGGKNSNPNVEYTSVPEGKTIEKALDPHVDTNTASGITTNTIIIKENEATEPTAEDYKTEIIDRTDISKEEKEEITETEEKIPVNTDNLPIDGEDNKKPDKEDKEDDKKEDTDIPTEEKVIIVEDEIIEDTNIDNLPIEESKFESEPTKEEIVTIIKVEEKEPTIDEKVTIIEEETQVTEENEEIEIPTEEKVIIVEDEIVEDTNIDNLPIEEETQEIINSVSEETGYTLVYTM